MLCFLHASFLCNLIERGAKRSNQARIITILGVILSLPVFSNAIAQDVSWPTGFGEIIYPVRPVPEFKLPDAPYLPFINIVEAWPCDASIVVADIPESSSAVITLSLPETGFWSDDGSRHKVIGGSISTAVSMSWIDERKRTCGILILNPLPSRDELDHPSMTAEQCGPTFCGQSVLEKDAFNIPGVGEPSVNNAQPGVELFFNDDAGCYCVQLNQATLVRWQESEEVFALYSDEGRPRIAIYEGIGMDGDFPRIHTLDRSWKQTQEVLDYGDKIWRIDDRDDLFYSYLRIFFGDGVVIYRYTNDRGESVYVAISSDGEHHLVTRQQWLDWLSAFKQGLLERLLPEYFGQGLPAGGGEAPEVWQKEHRRVPFSLLYRMARILSEQAARNVLTELLKKYRVREMPLKKKKGRAKSARGAAGMGSDQTGAIQKKETGAALPKEAIPSFALHWGATATKPNQNRIGELEKKITFLKVSICTVYVILHSHRPFEYVHLLLFHVSRALEELSYIYSLRRFTTAEKREIDALIKQCEPQRVVLDGWRQRMRGEQIVELLSAQTGSKVPDEYSDLLEKAIANGDLPCDLVVPSSVLILAIEKGGGGAWGSLFLPVIREGIDVMASQLRSYLATIRTLAETCPERVKVRYSGVVKVALVNFCSSSLFLSNPGLSKYFIDAGKDCRVQLAVVYADFLSFFGRMCSGRLPEVQIDISEVGRIKFEQHIVKMLEAGISDQNRGQHRANMIAEFYLDYWKAVAERLLTGQSLPDQDIATIAKGWLGCIEIFTADKNPIQANECFAYLQSWLHLQDVNGFRQLLVADRQFALRFLEAMETYSQSLQPKAGKGEPDTEEVRSKEEGVTCVQVKQVADFLQSKKEAFKETDKGKLDEIVAGLNAGYQAELARRQAMTCRLDELAREELEEKQKAQVFEAAAKWSRELSRRQQIHKEILQKRQQAAAGAEDFHDSGRSQAGSARDAGWQQVMGQAAQLLSEGQFDQAVSIMHDPAFNHEDVTLRFISLSELALIHMQKLERELHLLGRNRPDIDLFESLVDGIDLTVLEKFIAQNNLSGESTSYILDCLQKEGFKVYRRPERFAYYEDTQRFAQTLAEKKAVIEAFSGAISGLLQRFYALMLEVEIDEESVSSMTPFLLRAIKEYEYNMRWLEGRSEKMVSVLKKVKRISQLTGIYGRRDSSASESEPTRLTRVCEQLEVRVEVDHSIFAKLGSILKPYLRDNSQSGALDHDSLD